MAADDNAPVDENVLVRVENLVKYFPVQAGGFIRHTVGTCTRSTTCRSISSAARRSAWSARPAAASRRWPAAWPA